jgi:6,7-dimethyl-8-ribityllumazine synthase
MSTNDAKLPVAPSLGGAPPRLLIVRAPYYGNVVDGLTDGAERILSEVSAEVQRLDVAGAYEFTLEQALARSGRDGHNKGAEAAVAALLQIGARRRFGGLAQPAPDGTGPSR